MFGKILLVSALLSFAATGCYGNNCGVENCGTNQYCCQRSQSSISRCYYDRPPTWYSCKYINASSDTSYNPTKTTSAMPPTLTTKESTTESDTDVSTVATAPRALEISVSTSTKTTLVNLTPPDQSNNCGVENCGTNQYCCQRSQSSISRCYYDRPPTWYSCKYIKASNTSYIPTKTASTITPTITTEETTTELDETTVSAAPRALEISVSTTTEVFSVNLTTPNQGNNCGANNCGSNQFCCQRSKSSISRCYYDRPPTWYSCKYIKASNTSYIPAKTTPTIPETLTMRETTTGSDAEETTNPVGLRVVESSVSTFNQSNTTSTIPLTLATTETTTESGIDGTTGITDLRVLEIPESSTTEASPVIATTTKPSYNCGRRNCAANRFCCTRFGASWSVCYYDRLPFMYRCKYIYASKNKHHLPERTSTVKPKPTLTQTATTARSAFPYGYRGFPWNPPNFFAKWKKYRYIPGRRQ